MLKAKMRQSGVVSSTIGTAVLSSRRTGGKCPAAQRTPAFVNSRPNTAPATTITAASASIGIDNRRREAPNALRTANSRRRRTTLANRRPERLTQIISASSAAPASTKFTAVASLGSQPGYAAGSRFQCELFGTKRRIIGIAAMHVELISLRTRRRRCDTSAPVFPPVRETATADRRRAGKGCGERSAESVNQDRIQRWRR